MNMFVDWHWYTSYNLESIRKRGIFFVFLKIMYCQDHMAPIFQKMEASCSDIIFSHMIMKLFHCQSMAEYAF